MIVTTEAIVLHARKFGDTSRIVTLYTKEFGRTSVIAKGARHTKSKFGSALNPLSYISVTYYKQPNKDLHLLSKAETIRPLKRLGDSYDHLTLGLSIAEVMVATQELDEANHELFELLLQSLKALNAAEENPYSVYVSFQLHLAQSMGFAINLYEYTETDEKISLEDAADFVFSFANGAMFSPRVLGARIGFRLRSTVVGALQFLYDTPLERAGEIALSQSDKDQIQDFFAQYFSFHLERKFPQRVHNLRKISPSISGL
ncbi:MAG TPA: DNA repair protein RecO [Patescibacteria group bacterium]|nr:DNA repair protein RecO [Patescibacteria group bacterium]